MLSAPISVPRGLDGSIPNAFALLGSKEVHFVGPGPSARSLCSVFSCGSVARVEMGKRLSQHRGGVAAGGWLWYVALLCVLASASGLAGVGTAAKQSFAERAPASLGALVLGLSFLVVPLLRWRQRVEIFERGLVWSRLYGTVRITADQVRGVSWHKLQTRRGSHDVVKIELTGGRRHSIVGLSEPEKLVNFLRSWARLGVAGSEASRD